MEHFDSEDLRVLVVRPDSKRGHHGEKKGSAVAWEEWQPGGEKARQQRLPHRLCHGDEEDGNTKETDMIERKTASQGGTVG